jgi:hypothetical protein
MARLLATTAEEKISKKCRITMKSGNKRPSRRIGVEPTWESFVARVDIEGAVNFDAL